MWFSEESRWKPKPRWGSVWLGDKCSGSSSYGTCWEAKPRVVLYQWWHAAGSHPFIAALHKIQETHREIHCLDISWKQLLVLRICSWSLFIWQGGLYVCRKGRSPGSLLFNDSKNIGMQALLLAFQTLFLSVTVSSVRYLELKTDFCAWELFHV